MHLLWFPHCVIRALTNKSKKNAGNYSDKNPQRNLVRLRLCVGVCETWRFPFFRHCRRVTASDFCYCNLPGRLLVVQCAARLNGHITNAHGAITLRALIHIYI